MTSVVEWRLGNKQSSGNVNRDEHEKRKKHTAMISAECCLCKWDQLEPAGTGDDGNVNDDGGDFC